MQRIPLHELSITFARSSGPGGQNVNKTSTKATIHWSIARSRAFSDLEKSRLRLKLANRLTGRDELVVSSDNERSQPQNRAVAIRRLQMLVTAALRVPKKRTATKPTYSSKLRRLDSKTRHSKTKQARRGLFW